ncbi:MAG: FAD-dependent oxidoreductase [Bdellovibrionales bacterium]|nr:FAD-dependent oxidoreductase [Bdellovibrionales bacterium]
MARSPLFRKMQQLLQRALHPATLQEDPEIIDLSRRDFLRQGAWAAGSLTALGLARGAGFWLSAARAATDSAASGVVVLGGGLAGLTAAYTLARGGVRPAVYEAANRWGGRVFSSPNFNAAGQFCELGGELIDTNHEDLRQLCRQLGLALDNLLVGDRGVEPLLAYFGGRVRRESEILAAFAPLAKHLRRDAAEAERARFDRTSLAEYLHAKSDVDAWVREFIEVAYVGEYGLEASEQSALNLILLIDATTENGFKLFGASDEAWRIRGGNSRLPAALVKNLQSRADLHSEHKLVAIKAKGDGFSLVFSTAGATKTVQASRLVCALPFSVLREVEGIDKLGLSDIKLRSIRELGYGTNAKLMLGFRSRVWRTAQAEFPASSGEIFTDLGSQCFWETSRVQPGTSGILTNFLGGRAGASLTGVPDKALADLEKMRPGHRTAYSGEKAFLRWASNPYSRGSYSCPKPGQYESLIPAANKAELGGRIVFAGEHASEEFMGFMNGAAQSGRLAAESLLRPV